MFKLLTIFIGSMVFLFGAIGDEAHKMSKHPVSIKKMAQKTCPVLGGKINPNLYYQYKGEKIYVCCPGCIDTIKNNPEKYLKKVQEQKKEIEAAKNITQKNCPVIGGVIVPKLYYQYSKKIYVCCPECIATIKKDPEKYLKKVQKEVTAARKVTQQKCPVMGGKINPELYYKYKNKKIYVCCDQCIVTIKEDPKKYLKKVKKEVAAANKIAQKTCPVMGGKINPKLYYEYNKKIYVCCKDCIAKIKKNPEKYLRKMKQQQEKY